MEAHANEVAERSRESAAQEAARIKGAGKSSAGVLPVIKALPKVFCKWTATQVLTADDLKPSASSKSMATPWKAGCDLDILGSRLVTTSSKQNCIGGSKITKNLKDGRPMAQVNTPWRTRKG